MAGTTDPRNITARYEKRTLGHHEWGRTLKSTKEAPSVNAKKIIKKAGNIGLSLIVLIAILLGSFFAAN